MTSIAAAFHRRLPWGRFDQTAIILLGVAQAVGIGATVLMVWRVFDQLPAAGQTPGPAYREIAGLAGCLLFTTWLRYLEFVVTEKIGFNMVRRLRMAIYAHMSGMAPRQIQHRSRGSLILRLTGDLTMLRTWVSRGIARSTVGGIVATTCACALVIISPLLAATAGVVFALGFVISYLQGLAMGRATRRVRRRRSLLTSNVDEQVNALSVIQMFSRTKGEYARLSRQNDALTDALILEARIRGGLRASSAGTGWAAMLAVLTVGALTMPSGVEIGTIAAALTAVRYLSGAVQSLAYAHEYWRRAEVSRAKIVDFFNSSSRDLEEPWQARIGLGLTDIELRNVSVEGAVHDVSATIGKGRRIAIVGPAGAGKSTLLALIARMVEPDAGEILLGGRPMRDFTHLSTFRTIGMVSPDLPLLRGSVRRNLTYRKSTTPVSDLAWAAAATQLDQLLKDLPDGLDTWITEGGANLSVGQRQHLALARAVFGNPPILLLDEPTANLDPAGRHIVWDVIARHKGTIVMVTHDAREAAMADEVWLMREGRLVRSLSGEDYRNQRDSARIKVRPTARAEAQLDPVS